MATTSRTTYTHTCDLCGTAHPRHDLRRFGLVTISEGGPVSSRNPEIQGPPVDVCPACRERPISELLALLEKRKAKPDEAQRSPITIHAKRDYGMERTRGPGQVRKFTSADRWDYTVAELRQIAAEHSLAPPAA